LPCLIHTRFAEASLFPCSIVHLCTLSPGFPLRQSVHNTPCYSPDSSVHIRSPRHHCMSEHSDSLQRSPVVCSAHVHGVRVHSSSTLLVCLKCASTGPSVCHHMPVIGSGYRRAAGLIPSAGAQRDRQPPLHALSYASACPNKSAARACALLPPHLCVTASHHQTCSGCS
jgi:hypothetical protein